MKIAKWCVYALCATLVVIGVALFFEESKTEIPVTIRLFLSSICIFGGVGIGSAARDLLEV